MTTITGTIWINNNSLLASLNGLANLKTADVINLIENNSLANFCALQNILNSSTQTTVQIKDNLFNPSAQDIKSGMCAKVTN